MRKKKKSVSARFGRVKSADTSVMAVVLPERVHKKFGIACKKNGDRIKDVVEKMLLEYIKLR